MPSISEFFGITIYMYYAHARYQGSDASFAIETGMILSESLPPKVAKLIQEWTKRHREELMANWNKVLCKEPVQYIQGADND